MTECKDKDKGVHGFKIIDQILKESQNDSAMDFIHKMGVLNDERPFSISDNSRKSALISILEEEDDVKRFFCS